MKRLVNICILSVVLTILLPLCPNASARSIAQSPRTITGVVVEQDATPLAEATVCALGTLPMAGRLPCGNSNTTGYFSINVYARDTYTIAAEHLAKGYPPVLLRIPGSYGKPSPVFPTVVVDDSTVPSPVKIVMGAKAGRLLLTVFDGDTGERIDKGLVRFCKPGDSKYCYSISTSFPNGHYEVLTPEDPFTIKFETWWGPIPEYHGGVGSGLSGGWITRNAFDDLGLPLETLQVDLGQRKELTVRLK
jgi:hypothetical protein